MPFTFDRKGKKRSTKTAYRSKEKLELKKKKKKIYSVLKILNIKCVHIMSDKQAIKKNISLFVYFYKVKALSILNQKNKTEK
jgi:hypothetical protein